MSLPDTHLEHRSLTFSAWDRTELRLPQQKLAIPVAMVELWEMKWKRRSSRIFCADGGVQHGPTTPYSRRNASFGIPAMSSAKDA